jgi:hypothetical protein
VAGIDHGHGQFRCPLLDQLGEGFDGRRAGLIESSSMSPIRVWISCSSRNAVNNWTSNPLEEMDPEQLAIPQAVFS